jgi:uncharacterized protein YwqG
MQQPKPLKEYKVALEKVLEGQRAVTDNYPENLGKRTKLGGNPDWIQEPENILCPTCEKPMTFVAQIDSIEHQLHNNPHSVNALSSDQEYMFGDVGMLYLFYCFECSETTSTIQCY